MPEGRRGIIVDVARRSARVATRDEEEDEGVIARIVRGDGRARGRRAARCGASIVSGLFDVDGWVTRRPEQSNATRGGGGARARRR